MFHDSQVYVNTLTYLVNSLTNAQCVLDVRAHSDKNYVNSSRIAVVVEVVLKAAHFILRHDLPQIRK